MQTKRDVTQALRNRLKRVTAERNTLQAIAGQACLRIAAMEYLRDRSNMAELLLARTKKGKT